MEVLASKKKKMKKKKKKVKGVAKKKMPASVNATLPGTSAALMDAALAHVRMSPSGLSWARTLADGRLTPACILRQVEFYLGIQNLTRDKYYRSKMDSSEGWIETRFLLTAPRFEAYGVDEHQIAAAVASAPPGCSIESTGVPGNKKKLKRMKLRNTECTPEFIQGVMELSPI